MRRVTLALFLVASSLRTANASQEPAAKSTTDDAGPTRSCAAQPANPGSKAKLKGKSARNAKETVSACLDAKSPAMDIQEYLQSYVRKQGWRFGEEKIVADGWVFARYLEKDELLQFAKEGIFAGRVKWSEGKALVQVSTRELDGGFTRVEVSARLQGIGQSMDRFAPPKDTWDLDSTGALEKTLITALDTHLKSLKP